MNKTAKSSTGGTITYTKKYERPNQTVHNVHSDHPGLYPSIPRASGSQDPLPQVGKEHSQ